MLLKSIFKSGRTNCAQNFCVCDVDAINSHLAMFYILDATSKAQLSLSFFSCGSPAKALPLISTRVLIISSTARTFYFVSEGLKRHRKSDNFESDGRAEKQKIVVKEVSPEKFSGMFVIYCCAYYEF